MLHTHQSSQVLDRSQVFIFLQMSINNYSDLCLIIIIIKRERDWWNRKWLYIQHRCMKSFTRTTPTWSCMMPLPCTNIIMIILIHHSIFWSLRSSESVRLIFWPSSCASTFILRFWDNTPPPPYTYRCWAWNDDDWICQMTDVMVIRMMMVYVEREIERDEEKLLLPGDQASFRIQPQTVD